MEIYDDYLGWIFALLYAKLFRNKSFYFGIETWILRGELWRNYDRGGFCRLAVLIFANI